MKDNQVSPKGQHGGARPGSGRKPGSKIRRTKELIEKATAMGATPLEIMYKAMHEADGRGDMKAAAYYAQMAAPYIHPRLSTVNANHSGQVAVSVSIVSEFDE